MSNNKNTGKICPLTGSCACVGERCGFWMAVPANPCFNTAPAGECAVVTIADALVTIADALVTIADALVDISTK